MINITDKKNCCGCSACVQCCPKQCIAMHEDKEGFLYPKVDTSRCIDCGLCEKACPVINQSEPKEPLKTYAAINTNESMRMQSSSGGIFTLLAEYVINKGGVVFGVRYDENWEAVHDYTETIEGLAAFRGSKYMQSRMEDNYRKAKQFLQQGREVLFTGTSCQIAGLKKFLRKEYDNLLTADLICHGTPSPGVWRQYLKETVPGLILNSGDGKNSVPSATGGDYKSCIEAISFRSKITGWKKYSFLLKYHGGKNTGVFAENFSENAYMKAFLGNYILRPSCYACPAKSGMACSDITIADYWGIEAVLPEFDDDKGAGLVLSHTPKGEAILQILHNYQAIETTKEDALRCNSSYYKSVAVPPKREWFYQQFVKGTPVKDVVEKVYYVPLHIKIYRKITYWPKRVIRAVIRRIK